MRAKEFTTEAEGTFYHGTRSDFDFNQMSGGKGLVNFDRILGPHFSQTPDIANKFALYDPQTATAKRQQKQFGGKVYPVHIPGKVYVLPQKRGMLDMAAIALDAFMKVVLPNKELFDQYKEEVVKTEVKRTQRLRSLYKDHDYEKFPLSPIEVVEKRVKNNLGLYLDQKRYDWLSSPLFQLEFSNPELLHHIANEYKDLLMGQGYGVIQYRNTNPRETRGIEDKSSYIALMKPVSVFDKSGQIDEGWKDWAAAAGIGLAGLGGYQALNKPAPAPVQQVQPQLPVKQLKPMEKVLADAAQKAGIVGTELKQFLAQAAHETLDYHTLKELGTDRYVARKYDRKFNPVKAKTLGNIKPGDGAKYRGRGFIQLTGRYNYKEAGKALNLPLEQHPELVEKPEVAAATSIWFWKHRVQPKVADYHDVKQSTKPINPALKGLPSRQAHYDKYAQVDIPKNTPPIK